MSIIQRFIPSNPVNGERQEQIKRIIERVLKVFTTHYLASFKEVMVERAQAEFDRKQEQERIASGQQKGDKEPKPVRPRDGKVEKEKDPSVLKVKITGYEELDWDVDPYVAYTIEVSHNGENVTVYRRYKEFKELYKKMKKTSKEADLPPASSKWGGRNLSYDFIQERRKTLGSLLEAIVGGQQNNDNKFMRNWLGLDRPKDEVYDEVFKRAFSKSRWTLWIWKKIVWDKEGEAISKLICNEIIREMWWDITASVPPEPKVRKVALKAAWKTICGLVDPPTLAAWDALQKQVKELKEPVAKTVEGALVKILEVREQIKMKIVEGMNQAIDPVVKELKPFVKKLMKLFVPIIMEALQPILEQRDKYDKLFRDAFTSGNNEAINDLSKEIGGLKEQLNNKINEKLQSLISDALGDLKKEITIEAIGSIFSPLGQVLAIVNSFLKIIDPNNYLNIIKIMLDHKERILKGGPSEAEKHMDWEEWEVVWRTQWIDWDIRWAAREVWYNLWCLNDDLAPVAEAFYDWAIEYSEIHFKILHKFSWKFGDYLHGALEDKNDKRPFPEQVNWAMGIGYERAVKCGKKYIGINLHTHIRRLIKTPIVGPIEKMIRPLIKEVTEPLDSTIPPPINDIISVDGLVTDSINYVIEGVVDQCLDEQEADLWAELQKRGFSFEANDKFKGASKKMMHHMAEKAQDALDEGMDKIDNRKEEENGNPGEYDNMPPRKD